jgi:hypothetical protein
MKRNIVAFIAVVAVTLMLIGCSPEDRARKLMEKGKYEEILNDPKMKDLPIAKEARVKYADKLLANGKFEEIWNKYRDTPAAIQAKSKIAQQYFRDRKYQMILDSFPDSPLVEAARFRLTDTTRIDTARHYDAADHEERAAWWLAEWKKKNAAGEYSPFGAQETLRRLCMLFNDTKPGQEACTLYRDIYQADPKIPLPQ